MSKSSKRERRPNVRLEAIGDLPAAVSFVHKVSVYMSKHRWRCPDEKMVADATGFNFSSGDNSCAVTDLGCLGSVKVENCSNADEMQQNIETENTNPNSCKPVSVHSTSVGVGLGKAKVEFSNVTKKRRVMKRKPQTSNSGNGSFGSAWNNSRHGSYNKDDNIKKHPKATYQFNSFGSSDMYPVIWSSGHSGPEFSTSKQGSKDCLTQRPLAITNESNSEEFAHHTDNEHMSRDKGMFLYGVGKWLEERGFGNYVELFETHEVDEEALPLLTFEDLKEIGVNSVGPRRKLYDAIRQLRGTNEN